MCSPRSTRPNVSIKFCKQINLKDKHDTEVKVNNGCSQLNGITCVLESDILLLLSFFFVDNDGKPCLIGIGDRKCLLTSETKMFVCFFIWSVVGKEIGTIQLDLARWWTIEHTPALFWSGLYSKDVRIVLDLVSKQQKKKTNRREMAKVLIKNDTKMRADKTKEFGSGV